MSLALFLQRLATRNDGSINLHLLATLIGVVDK